MVTKADSGDPAIPASNVIGVTTGFFESISKLEISLVVVLLFVSKSLIESLNCAVAVSILVVGVQYAV